MTATADTGYDHGRATHHKRRGESAKKERSTRDRCCAPFLLIPDQTAHRRGNAQVLSEGRDACFRLLWETRPGTLVAAVNLTG